MQFHELTWKKRRCFYNQILWQKKNEIIVHKVVIRYSNRSLIGKSITQTACKFANQTVFMHRKYYKYVPT